MRDDNEFSSDFITLTGAGFTKSFFPEAPLLGESLEKTLEWIDYERNIRKRKVYDGHLNIYTKFQRENKDLETLLTDYFELLEKETKTSEEMSEYVALGYLKYAFLHLIDDTTPWKNYWKDLDFSLCPESIDFNEYRRWRQVRKLADYFISKLGRDLQVTVNYDTVLECIFESYPEPEDYRHRIQHIHGSRAWHIHPTTKKAYSNPEMRAYSNLPDDPLILPINNKEKWAKRFPWYESKKKILEECFKKCKRLTIIGCGLNKNDEILGELIKSLNSECKVIYVTNSCEKYERIRRIFEPREILYLSCGFRIGCLG